MLFKLSPDTPSFQIFELLNEELMYFIGQAVSAQSFCQKLFSETATGKACWNNSRRNSQAAKSDLTREKFENLFISLHSKSEKIRFQLFEKIEKNQKLEFFFENPDRNLLDFLPEDCLMALKNLTTHLYCATKDISSIKNAANGVDITSHFNAFRNLSNNGEICKACGMKELSAFRASVPDGHQWRADYDHQLCKSKYPIFAVHPQNLIPLCDVCNQDAKRAKDLFIDREGNFRLAFFPHLEEAQDSVDFDVARLRDPEPAIKVVWKTSDPIIKNKLETWDEIYEIRNRVEGKLRSLEVVIEDQINPVDFDHLKERVLDMSRNVPESTLKRKEWAFWYQKLFQKLSEIDLEPFIAKSQLSHQHGIKGGSYILGI